MLPGKRLYLLATGTGLAPFLSVIRDPETYERYEQVVLIHGVRQVKELAYREYLSETLAHDEFLGEMVQQKLLYYPTVTREPFVHQGRIPQLLAEGQVAKDLGIPMLNPAEDRIMICGSPEMLRDLKALVRKAGLRGRQHQPSRRFRDRACVCRNLTAGSALCHPVPSNPGLSLDHHHPDLSPVVP